MTPSWRVIVLSVFVIGLANMNHGEDKYLHLREAILKNESEAFIGAGLNLTAREDKVDQYLLKLKKHELLQFFPAESFLTARDKIHTSKVFVRL